mmetsp:Transcript_39583/g.60534  ORF Transcript_39583/g.60534 Transcript_39583/m.60534 type:complete len:96 (+) Transcript_39583:398-685(+)
MRSRLEEKGENIDFNDGQRDVEADLKEKEIFGDPLLIMQKRNLTVGVKRKAPERTGRNEDDDLDEILGGRYRLFTDQASGKQHVLPVCRFKKNAG